MEIQMQYRRCGASSLRLPVFSLGMWHNFGSVDPFDEARRMILTAFDKGITHFDLANNYGPEPGSAESNFGKILKSDLAAHRDEMFVASKAGWYMWPGPYGDGSSRKYLIASCDQSLRRTGLEYFDVFYSHRYDGETPVEETMQALVDIVRQGKALYAGISSYPADKQKIAYEYLQDAHVPCLLSQYHYNMFNREPEAEIIPNAAEAGSGMIIFSPLAQGLLTGKYNDGIPADSRIATKGGRNGAMTGAAITPEKVEACRKLQKIADARGQKLGQMALAWLLRDPRVTSVILGPRNVGQLLDNLATLEKMEFSKEELEAIEEIV